MIRDAISALVEGNSLSFPDSAAVMEELMTGQAVPSQVGAFLTALRMKGETVEEIAGMVTVMREKSLHVHLSVPAIDIVGTGGDGSGSYNISTAASFVAAGAGLFVAKHGNRAASSKCGSADVLEALGARLELSPESVRLCVEDIGIGFMFAPVYHPSMKYLGPSRKEIGIRTIFNILGPLTNPARVPHLLLGVASESIGTTIASVLHRLGTTRSLVVHGTDGFDELSVSADSLVWEISHESPGSAWQVTPEEFGCHYHAKSAMAGGSPGENADMLRRLLQGEHGAFRDAVVMNAAAALMTCDSSLKALDASMQAVESIDSGKAFQKLENFVKLTRKLQ